MCAEVEHPFGFECAGAKVEMWRACHCSVSHAFVISSITTIQGHFIVISSITTIQGHFIVISSITTIQDGYDAMRNAKADNHNGIVRVLEQVSE